MIRRLIPALLILTAAASAQPAARGPELRYVVILTRHGVRAPTWTPERLNEYSTAPWPDFKVPPGNLTPHGRTLMELMGAYYRELYRSQGLLSKEGCGDAGRVYIWADTDQRTLETGSALAEQLLPGCKTTIHSKPGGGDDPLFDPISAKTAKQDAQLGLAAVTGRIGPKLDAVVETHRPAFDVLNEVLNGSGKAKRSLFDAKVALTAAEDGVAMSGPLATASTFTENLLLEYTNGMSGNDFGWGRLTPAKLEQVMALHTAYADLMRRTPYLARVRSSNLLRYILNGLEQAATGKSANRMLVISGHDTNISNISGMLDLSWLIPSYQRDDVAPGGALVFSLWRSSTGQQTVRLQLISQTMDQMHNATPLSLDAPPAVADIFIPACGTSREGYACDWPAFRNAVTAAFK